MLERAEHLLGREDADIAWAATDILTGDGIVLITGATVVEVRDNATVSTVAYEKDGQTRSETAQCHLIRKIREAALGVELP